MRRCDPHGADLDSPEATVERIRQQTAAASRNGWPFSVVSFHAGQPEMDRRRIARLLSVLHHRLRRGDEIGWIDCGWLAVLLPQAGSKGARTFATNIVAAFAPHDRPLPYQTYTYSPRPGNRTDTRTGPGTLDGTDTGPCNDTCPGTGADGQQQGRRRAGREAEPVADAVAGNPMPAWKRTMDVIGAGFGLIALSPLLLASAVLVKLTSRGPVLFRQVRAGMNGVPFAMYKFRTMVDGADAMKASLRHLNERSGPVFKIRKDPRVTLLGRFLRATSIDELPQLWNVLRGDMSLVGPRPPTPDEVSRYEHWQLRRLEGKPGITCIWQVYGRQGVEFTDWVRMDLQYLQRRSLVLDLKLLLLTLGTVLSLRGAH